MSGQRSHSKKVSDPKDLKSQPTLGLPLLALQETNTRFFRSAKRSGSNLQALQRTEAPGTESTSLSLSANLPTGGNATQHRGRRRSRARNHSTVHCKDNALGSPATQGQALASTKLRRIVLPPADQKGEDEGKCRAHI